MRRIHLIRRAARTAPPSTSSRGDLIIPYLQSMMLEEKMTAAIGKEHVILKRLEKVGHADWGFFKLTNINKVIDFLDRYLK
jgi:hypothetical protein